ncbi:MAG: carboxypeptidase regulatory-like domain-containing protein [Acidobacteria bacterium]|nr:carboxypeptidase regulatory-like domain-containing protein [Acidobacteriota bacterium]
MWHRALLLTFSLPVLLVAQSPQPNRPLPRPAPEAPPPETNMGHLRVHVVNPMGAPVDEAWVSVPKAGRTFPTGETGDVVMVAIPVGDHEVVVTKEGYKEHRTSTRVEKGRTTVLEVRLAVAAK